MRKPRTFKIIKSEKGNQSFLDMESKLKSFMPPPGHYQLHRDWPKELSDYSYGGSPNKGKFPKGHRVTSVDEVIKHHKKASLPGPGTYDFSNLDKP